MNKTIMIFGIIISSINIVVISFFFSRIQTLEREVRVRERLYIQYKELFENVSVEYTDLMMDYIRINNTLTEIFDKYGIEYEPIIDGKCFKVPSLGSESQNYDINYGISGDYEGIESDYINENMSVTVVNENNNTTFGKDFVLLCIESNDMFDNISISGYNETDVPTRWTINKTKVCEES